MSGRHGGQGSLDPPTGSRLHRPLRCPHIQPPGHHTPAASALLCPARRPRRALATDGLSLAQGDPGPPAALGGCTESDTGLYPLSVHRHQAFPVPGSRLLLTHTALATPPGGPFQGQPGNSDACDRGPGAQVPPTSRCPWPGPRVESQSLRSRRTVSVLRQVWGRGQTIRISYKSP